MHRRPDWETERVALVQPPFLSPRTPGSLAASREGRGGPLRSQLRVESWGGSAKPIRRWLQPRPLGSRPGGHPSGWPLRVEEQFRELGGFGTRRSGRTVSSTIKESRGMGETRQFKADRLRKRATRHSNF
jgi:hypothetical protein